MRLLADGEAVEDWLSVERAPGVRSLFSNSWDATDRFVLQNCDARGTSWKKEI